MSITAGAPLSPYEDKKGGRKRERKKEPALNMALLKVPETDGRNIQCTSFSKKKNHGVALEKRVGFIFFMKSMLASVYTVVHNIVRLCHVHHTLSGTYLVNTITFVDISMLGVTRGHSEVSYILTYFLDTQYV